MYKLGPDGRASTGDAQTLGATWLQSLVDIQDDTRDSAEFLEHVKVDLFPDAVYVFTPRSKILALPRGATPVDFAYAIHSDVGDRCVAVKVNGEPVLLRTELRSGDVVEIITAPGARPNPAWLNHVRTGRARAKIRHYLRTMEQEESHALGEKMLAQALRAEGLPLPADGADDEAAASLWQQLARWAGVRNRSELLVDIGLGRRIAVIVAKRMAQMMAERGVRPDAVTLTLGHYAPDDAALKQGVVFIDGSQDSTIRLATCCRPIPGDAVTGYLGKGEGLTVHTDDCRTARRLHERDSERWMHVEWAEQPVRTFETGLVVEVGNSKGALAQVASAIGNAEADITRIDMGHESGNEVAELRLLVAVRDRTHLADVMRTLRRAAPVLKVARIKP
jgi:GTP pyrophosphokinase/guanosine-3',5'-bis(diphosphate) 3'-pyrophosphohydrolase